MNNQYTDNNITYTWPDKMPVSSALAGLFTNALWAPIDPLDPHRQKYYNYNPVGKTPEELLKLKSISALDILWCNPKFEEEGAVPRIKSIPSEINTTTDLFNWIRYYDYTFKYIKLDTHCDYKTKYLTFVVTDGGDITWSGSTVNNKLSYSTDDGVTWSTASDNITLSVDEGDRILWKGTTSPIYEYGIGQFNGNNGVRYDVEGNIMSLLFGDNFKDQTSLNNDYTFYQLFCENKYIINAENLSLPATTLDDNCYGEMFYGCTNLITAPFELPATILAGGCYEGMFEGCTNLITAPFELPATTLASGCYERMFEGCTNLTTAPKLPARTLTRGCYYGMFQGCESLNSITCLATDISASDCTFNWVEDVMENGTFIKNPTMENWLTGTSGIPSGWTISNYKSKIDCVKYRIFNKNFDQIGYFGNDGTDDKKFNIKSYYDLSIKSLGHINISAFNNCIKFNESELNIIGGGKRFNINMPWDRIFSSNRDGVTISHKTNSTQGILQNAITLYSGGIKIKHNNEDKELFIDIAYYMQPQNIGGQADPVYPRMSQAYNYTYGNQLITPIVISYSVNNSNKTYLYFPYYEYGSTGIHIEPIAKKYFVFEYKNSLKGYYFDREITSDVDKTQVLVFDNPRDELGDNTKGKQVYERVVKRLSETPGQVVPIVWHDSSDGFELFDGGDGGWLQGCAYQRQTNEVIIDMYGVGYVIGDRTNDIRAFVRLAITKDGNTYNWSEYLKNLDATATTTTNGLMSSADKSKLDNAVTVQAQSFNENQRKQVCTNIHAVSYDAGQTLDDPQRANARAHIHAVSYDASQNLEESDKQNARANIGAASTAVATTKSNGLMSSTDKSILDNYIVRVDKDQSQSFDEDQRKQACANIHAVSYDANQNLGDTDKQNARNNIAAAAASSDLIGEIKMWCSSIIPDGYLLCDGRTFDTTTYPELYEILGTNTVPNLIDRFIVGAGNKYPIGQIGGEETHELNIDEMPAHRHNVVIADTGDTGSGTAITCGGEGGQDNFEHKGGFKLFPSGGSKPHNNMPPYYALTYIIKAQGYVFTQNNNNIIYYKASKQLAETTVLANGGLHTNAFYGDNDQLLTKINHTFSNGVGTIVFNKNVVKIGDYAFYKCSGTDIGNLTEITIPNSVTDLGNYAFSESGLINISIPNNVTEIGQSAFEECEELLNISIGSGVTNISDNAFKECLSLKEIRIPDSVTNLGAYAFSGCTNLYYIIIGNGITEIKSYTFNQCFYSSEFNDKDGGYIDFGNNIDTIGDHAFNECRFLNSVTIPYKVTNIGNYAFNGCYNMRNLSFENNFNLTNIGDYAFCGCVGLSSISLPYNVEEIGERCFDECTGIYNVFLGLELTNVGQYAFHNCIRLRSLIIANIANAPTIDSTVFSITGYSSHPPISVYVPNTNIYDGWSSYLPTDSHILKGWV